MTSIILNDEAQALPKELQELVQDCVDKTLEFEEFPFSAEVSFSITDNEGIRELNLAERNIDKVTDVLSFPMLTVEDGVLIVEDEDMMDDTVFLGDIVISLPKAEEQAGEYGHSLERELGFLTVHSMLHLLGYDHEDGPREESEMFQKQEEILEALELYR
ncbi:MAG: rRNA maturation RNase YbeY [Ruminococcaceae bacterium]|nr:rRNA maturation RNase YbeY [Oscillospiraceae bacterium]